MDFHRRADPAGDDDLQRRADLAGVLVGAGRPVAVMGVLNVSPASFYRGSVRAGTGALCEAARAMVAEGADIVDVGARSTAPYAGDEVGEAEEAERLGEAVEALVRAVPVPVSADTAGPAAARAALEAGARILNDVSGLRDPATARLVAGRGASAVLMASPAGPLPAAGDPVEIVADLLARALGRAGAAGIPAGRVVLDPGIGFFRHGPIPWHEWDVRVLAGLARLAWLGRPLCVGVSRKSFVGALTGRDDPAERLAGSLAATAAAVWGGAAVIRAHDVRETLDAVRVAQRLREAGPPRPGGRRAHAKEGS